MRTVLLPDPDALSQAAADLIAEAIARRPDAAASVATGSAPMGADRELAARRAAGRLDASRLRAFQLDAYLGLGPDDRRSLYRWMKESFLDPLGMPVLLAARRTLLLVAGGSKREILRRALEEAGTPDLSASYLRRAADATVLADAAAAAALGQTGWS